MVNRKQTSAAQASGKSKMQDKVSLPSSRWAQSAVGDGLNVALEARKSKPHPVTNKVSCLACGKAFQGFSALEKHLKAKHHGLNAREAIIQTKEVAKSTGKRNELSLVDYVSPKSNAGKKVAAKLASNLKQTGISTSSVWGKNEHIKGKLGEKLIVNTNTASSTGLVVRRGKERVGGKKEKVSKVKVAVLLERSKNSGLGATELLHSEVQAYQKKLAKEIDLGEEVSGNSKDTKAVEIELAEHDLEEEGNSSDERKEEASSLLHTSAALSKSKLCEEQENSQDNPDMSSDTVASSTSNRTVPVYCELCNVSCPNSQSYIDHCKGRLHVSKTCRRLQENDNGKGLPQKQHIKQKVQSKDAVNVQDATEMNNAVISLIQRLLFLQARAHKRDPLKAKKRIVFGFNEVHKSVKVKKCKLLIVANNMEAPLMESLEEIIALADSKEIPVIFALSRSKLGKLLKKGVRVSMASVLDPSGGEEDMKAVTSLRMLQKADAMETEVEFKMNASAQEYHPSHWKDMPLVQNVQYI